MAQDSVQSRNLKCNEPLVAKRLATFVKFQTELGTSILHNTPDFQEVINHINNWHLYIPPLLIAWQPHVTSRSLTLMLHLIAIVHPNQAWSLELNRRRGFLHEQAVSACMSGGSEPTHEVHEYKTTYSSTHPPMRYISMHPSGRACMVCASCFQRNAQYIDNYNYTCIYMYIRAYMHAFKIRKHKFLRNIIHSTEVLVQLLAQSVKGERKKKSYKKILQKCFIITKQCIQYMLFLQFIIHITEN